MTDDARLRAHAPLLLELARTAVMFARQEAKFRRSLAALLRTAGMADAAAAAVDGGAAINEVADLWEAATKRATGEVQ